MKKIELSFFITIISILIACNPTNYADPFIGTGGHGHTFPGATVPFGMVQLSPDTRIEGWDGCSGYHNSDSIVHGFSHTHLSGTGVGDYCDILLKPCLGEFVNWYNASYPGLSLTIGYSSYFDKKSERANPGYYKVKLKEGIEVELTATSRAGMHRYTFEEVDNPHIILDLTHRDKLLGSDLEIVDNQTVRGSRRSQSWAADQQIFFQLEFSKSFISSEQQEISIITSDKEERKIPGKSVFHFELEEGDEILVKVGISAVDAAGAANNLKAEMPDWNFDSLRQAADSIWNDELSKIEVSGMNQDDKSIFYTALYHSMIAPNLFSDVDGRYRKMVPKDSTDLRPINLFGQELTIGEYSIQQENPIGQLAEGENQYTVFSLWDTYRATHPLYTIIDSTRTNQYIRSFLRQYQDGGQLPVWELAGNYTGCMIGYHSVSVIADAYTKGIRDYDTELAFKAMAHSANLASLGREEYLINGFIPSTDEPESVSKTLEYAYDDWCIAHMAEQLGKENSARHFYERAQFYKNLYNQEAGFIMGRSNGGWVPAFRPEEVNFNYTEANGWQYSLAVPQDISGLIELMGGEQAFEKHLDELFSTDSETSGRHQADITGLIGQYAHGNEPSHHMAYLYNYIGKPWKTQQMVNRIMNEMYQNAPDGLSGNEDCGQMSSWYVLSALGFYPVLPGSDEYVIGTPRFAEATINLENGKSFTIRAEGIGDTNIYIQSVELDSVPYSKSYLTHNTIKEGGVLEFKMGSKPNENWGSALADRPHSKITAKPIAIKPSIEAASKTFEDSLLISMNCAEADYDIYYTTDGSAPIGSTNHYEAPFYIEKSMSIRAAVISQNGGYSQDVKAEFYKIPKGRSITLSNTYSNQYTAGGDNALIDYLRGGTEFRTGGWQGYEGVDLEAIVDLGKATDIQKIGLSCLQDIKSWIWFPTEIVYYISQDGENFKQVGSITNDFPDNQYGAYSKIFESNIGQKARFVKVIAKNYGQCPDWHLGNGGTAWLFADEILID